MTAESFRASQTERVERRRARDLAGGSYASDGPKCAPNASDVRGPVNNGARVAV